MILRTSTALAALVASLTLAQAASAAESQTLRLSDERLLSRWAYPAETAVVRKHHDNTSARMGKLRLFTEDREPEVYLLLERFRDDDGEVWVKLRLPQKPNGVTGWVPRDALGDYHVTHQQLVINRKTFRAHLYNRGKVIWSAVIGVGAVGTKTPPGRFWIREKIKFARNDLYGTRALGTAAYAPISDWPGGGMVGVHGTGWPELLPGRVSHGCVRVRNQDMAKLFRLAEIGAPLWIR